jgi:hypothetical protein
MRLVAMIAVSISLCTLSCQQYSTGVHESLARADETVVLSALRTISIAQRAYSLSNAGEFGTFEQLVQGDYLDQRFNSVRPIVKDYALVMAVNPKSPKSAEGFFSCNADPERAGNRAGRHYYIDSTSTEIHVNANEPATAQDEIIH